MDGSPHFKVFSIISIVFELLLSYPIKSSMLWAHNMVNRENAPGGLLLVLPYSCQLVLVLLVLASVSGFFQATFKHVSVLWGLIKTRCWSQMVCSVNPLGWARVSCGPSQCPGRGQRRGVPTTHPSRLWGPYYFCSLSPLQSTAHDFDVWTNEAMCHTVS